MSCQCRWLDSNEPSGGRYEQYRLCRIESGLEREIGMRKLARSVTAAALSLILGTAVAVSGCDGAPSTSAVAPTPAASGEGFVRLSAKESLRVGVAVAPVVRSEFRKIGRAHV